MPAPVIDPRRSQPRRGYERRPSSSQPQYRPSTGFRPTSTRDTPPETKERVAPDSPTDFYSPEQAEQKALGLDTPTKDKAAEAERQKVAGESGYYNNEGPADKGRVRGFIRRHKKGVAGGGVAGLVLGGGFGLFLFLSGPLEFIHLSQLMQQFHFSDNEDVNDNNLTRFYRWMRWQDKPGNRRLSEIGNNMADKLQVRFEEAGWAFDLDERGYLNGFDIDVETARAHGVDVDGLAAELDVPIENGKLRIDIDANNPFKFYRNKKVIRESRKAIRHTGVVASLESNKLGRRGGFTRHPIEALDRTVREQGIDAMKAAWRKLRSQKMSGDLDPIRLSGTDSDGDPATQNEGEQFADDINDQVDGTPADDLGHKSSSLKKSIFSAAALTTAYCIARDLADGASDEEWAQIGLGSEIVASYYMGLGSQVMSSQDLDFEQLGFEKELLFDDSDDGNPATEPSSWSSADSIQKLSGNPGGVALGAAYRLNSGQNMLAEILDAIPGASLLDPVCDAANSWIGQAIQLTIDFATGPISTVFGEIGGALFGDDVINFLTRILTGEGLPFDLAGAALGGVIDQGSFFLSSQELLARGAKALNPVESREVRHYLAELDRQEFQTKPFLSRLFDVGDRRSLAAKTYYEAPRDTGSIFAGLIGLPQNTLGSLVRLGSQPAYALDENDIDYGISKFSFSLDERDSLDDSHDNPYENVSVLLSGGALQQFNDEGFDSDCFGLELDTTNDNFEVVGLPRLDNYGDAGTSTEKCVRNDDMWLRYRLHISNVMTATEIACYEADEIACRALGYGVVAAETPTANPVADATIVGDPYTDTTGVPCAAGTRDVGIHDGYVDGRLFPVRLCSLPNLPSSGLADNPGREFSVPGADGHALVNSRVSGAWFALVNDAASAGVTLSATSSFRTAAHQEYLWDLYGHDTARVARPGYSPHQAGVAIDFAGMHSFISGATCDGRASVPSSPGWVWLRDNAERYGFKQYAAEAWHWDALQASNRCGTP